MLKISRPTSNRRSVPSDQFVIVLTTLPVEGDAEKFAAHLVEEKLAACVNILPPMRSVYRWKEAVERADERQILIKTTKARLTALEARIRELHPYEVPEFVVVPIAQGSQDYLSWIVENTSK
jgi:periplasmic divalent cation tolerance protein